MKLEIKEPCHEDWDKMKIGLISRHCGVCEKSVMDFTKMNRAEIITYILSNSNDQVCGRLNRDQFDFHHEDIPILIETLKREKTANPFLILALVCLSLSSCAQEDTSNINTPLITEITLGQVEIPQDLTIRKDTTKDVPPLPLKGKVACDIDELETVTQGEIGVPVAGGIGIVENPNPENKDKHVRQFAEIMPTFKGGIEGLDSFVNRHLKYPEYERKQGIQGNIYVRFVVEEDGRITRPEILQSVAGSKNMDSEVLRLIKIMPRWTAGSNNGKNVPVYMSIPIQFIIN